MSRKVPLVALPVAVVLALTAALAPAQPNKADVPEAPSTQLPIARVILFTSGVAYFQRQGEVENNAHIDLSFPVQEINDLLKSLVLRDLSGGQVRAVGYDSQDPIGKTLKTFSINLNGNPSFGQILEQARGEKVEVTWQLGKGGRPLTVTGTILGVEKQKQPAGKDTLVDVEMLNLWTKDGIRSLQLSETSQIQFLNPTLEDEMKQALGVLARSRDTRKKAVRLNFSGKGKRQVQVGYVVEHPLWQTSYRLVLNGQGKPYLQGWALVENPSSEDWNKVHVQLVSGRPISFRMDLYQPLYVERPLVELEHFASLRPRAYEGALGTPPPAAPAPKAESKKAAVEEFRFKAGEKGVPPFPTLARLNESQQDAAIKALQESVPSAARGEKLGDFFQYVIAQPVNLPRQKSAMLPIVTGDVQASKVSIYNEKVQDTYPLLGLKFKNTTGLHLMQGPITVFEEDSYAGDALIRDLQPNEERLVSYAVDLGMEVKPEAKKHLEQVVRLKIVHGVAEKTILLRDAHVYQIKNRSGQDRLLLIEHPNRSPEFKLVTPSKPHTETRDTYRFEVAVPKGEQASFPVVEEQQVVQGVVLANADDQTLRLLVESPASSPALQAALQRAVELKAKLATTQREVSRVEGQLKGTVEDQGRQRENLKVIPASDPAYRKYLEKFLKQDTEIERLREEVSRLQTVAAQQREAYETFVQNLTVKE